MAKKTKKKQIKKTEGTVKNKGGAPLGNKNAVGNKGGRESLYKPEYCEQLIEFISTPRTSLEFERQYYSTGELKSEKPILIAPDFPRIEDFAYEVAKVTPKCLLGWADKYVEFGIAYARAKAIQERLLLVNGLNGQYNAGFVQFLLKNNFGYKDKIEAETKSLVTDSIEEFLKSDKGISL